MRSPAQVRVVRAATRADVPAAVRLIRSAFPAVVRARVVYGCAGAEAWVEDALAAPAALAERQFTVAIDGGNLLGIVDLQRRPDALFLAYVAIDDGARSGGIATELLSAALDRAMRPAVEHFELDVFEDNAVPLGWYERLGLVPVSRSVWRERDLSGTDGAAGPGAIVLDLPSADVAHERFGFSQLRVAIPGATYTVGRIGGQLFRVTDAEAFSSVELHAALRRLDPTRRLLGVLPDTGDGPADAGAPALVRSVRMRGSIATVRANLAHTLSRRNVARVDLPSLDP